MRILIVSSLFPPHVLGGYEIACRNMAIGLRARGHEVEVLASYAPMAAPDDPPWLHRVFTLRSFEAVPAHTVEVRAAIFYEAGCSQYPNTAALLAHLRRFKPDVVYAWHLWGIGGLALLDVLEQVGVPWVFHLMDNVPGFMTVNAPPLAVSLFAGRDHSLLARARVITMSQQILDEIAQTSGIRFEMPPTVVPGWVDARGLAMRARYREGGQLRLVAAGSLGVHKGIDIVVDACAQLAAAGHANFHVDVYGFGNAEPWVARAEGLGVGRHFRFLGPRTQSELLALLSGYDVFLFPTQHREPFGFAPIEAAACGAVPVVTRNAGCAERMVDEIHCLKIDRNAGSLAGAVARLLTGEVDVEALGRRAALMVRTELDFERCLRTVEEVLGGATTAGWDHTKLDEPRLPALMFAKHALGQYFTAHQ